MNVKIMGADQALSNASGANWLPTLQAATQRARLYTISYNNLSIAAVNLWFFDSAAATTTNPVMVRRVAIGADGIFNFEASGKLFNVGIYIIAATNLPTDATTAATAAANNAMILSADVRIK
jgi:hypothetical protein